MNEPKAEIRNPLTSLRRARQALEVAYSLAQRSEARSARLEAERKAREALTHTIDAIAMLSGLEAQARTEEESNIWIAETSCDLCGNVATVKTATGGLRCVEHMHVSANRRKSRL